MFTADQQRDDMMSTRLNVSEHVWVNFKRIWIQYRSILNSRFFTKDCVWTALPTHSKTGCAWFYIYLSIYLSTLLFASAQFAVRILVSSSWPNPHLVLPRWHFSALPRSSLSHVAMQNWNLFVQVKYPERIPRLTDNRILNYKHDYWLYTLWPTYFFSAHVSD